MAVHQKTKNEIITCSNNSVSGSTPRRTESMVSHEGVRLVSRKEGSSLGESNPQHCDLIIIDKYYILENC